MINVTEAAQAEIKGFFKARDIKPVRIFLNQGCGGAQLAMALDDKKETDSATEFDGVAYLMDTTLLESATPVEIDFSGTGFQISSSLELSSGCSSCGTKGSCCS
ncbi:MAG: IscA/HesB family protein [Desulfobacterium sp.]